MFTRTLLMGATLIPLLFNVSTEAQAHCQVPCGIYDDGARFTGMREDVTTIAKATAEIEKMAGKDDATSANQVSRWVTTKEEHASRIIEVVSTYFLTQKIKPVASDDKDHASYLNKLQAAHQVMRAAMKAKQTVSADAVKGLSDAIDSFEKSMK
jgi:nickel superoxide dismutase